MIRFILLGAEGVAESEGLPYIRRATEGEAAAFEQAALAALNNPATRISPMTTRDVYIDGMGRPYWLVIMDLDHPDCPESVRRHCADVVRTVHMSC
jgi:hypothetical protein